MGYYVAVNFSFPSNNSEWALRNLQQAARDAKSKIGEEGRYTGYMLDDIIEDPNRYVHGGNKGDMFTWGGVWNYYSAEGELPSLKIFMLEAYKNSLENGHDEPIFDFERAILLVEPEQSERLQIYQIALKENGDERYLPEIVVKSDTLEFSWGQM